jgi:hypothetical protein
MDTRAWHKVEDKQGLVLALTGDTLHHFSFSGKAAKREASEAVTALAEGRAPFLMLRHSVLALSAHNKSAGMSWDRTSCFALSGLEEGWSTPSPRALPWAGLWLPRSGRRANGATSKGSSDAVAAIPHGLATPLGTTDPKEPRGTLRRTWRWPLERHRPRLSA